MKLRHIVLALIVVGLGLVEGVSAQEVSPDDLFVVFESEYRALLKESGVNVNVTITVAHGQIPGFRIAWSFRKKTSPDMTVVIGKEFLANATPTLVEHAARHEYCHLALGHFKEANRKMLADTPVRVEQQTEQCVRNIAGAKRYEEYRTQYKRWVPEGYLAGYLVEDANSILLTMAK